MEKSNPPNKGYFNFSIFIGFLIKNRSQRSHHTNGARARAARAKALRRGRKHGVDVKRLAMFSGVTSDFS